MSELVTQLTRQLKAGSAVGREGRDAPDASKPNLNRLTVGVDLGDQWSNYCILGLSGETLTEGQLRTSPQPIGEFFKGLCRSRVVIEVGTHSAWVREVIAGIGHEVLVADGRIEATPAQEDSGDSQPQLGISKAGGKMLRHLPVGGARYVLGPFGPDCDLRRFGMELCERGGKNAKKRATVAVARKLAVLPHRLWISGEVYERLRQHSLALTSA